MIKKRIFAILIVLSLLLSVCGIAAMAVEARASVTLLYYNAILTEGNSSGELEITYDVQANTRADKVGVSNVKIYKSDGSYVTTINGSVNNGMLEEDTSRHRSSCFYNGTSGTYYYAVVTVTATIGSDSDSREITTSTVKAP